MKPIVNTFVLIAPDSERTVAAIPAGRGTLPTVGEIHYQLLMSGPYTLTLEDLILATYLRRSGLGEADAAAREQSIRTELFSRPHPCMRASPLTKKLGWGIHHDGCGRMALFPVESQDYRRFAAGEVPGVALVHAMRSKRPG